MLSPATRKDESGKEQEWESSHPSRLPAKPCARIREDLAGEEGWKSVREVNLPRTFKISAGAVEIEGHHAEVCLVRSEDMTYLPQHFLDTHIAAGVARAVIAREEQLQLFSRSPALTEAEPPAEAVDFNKRTDPGDEMDVRHARA